MSTRTTIIVVSIMIIASTLVGIALWSQLPDPMASHWDASDQVNGYMSKFWRVPDAADDDRPVPAVSGDPQH